MRFRGRLHILLGFSSGAVLGVILFDVLPELIDRIERGDLPVIPAMVVIAAGFMWFFLLERTTHVHAGHGNADAHDAEPGGVRPGPPADTRLGVIGAAGLSLHSFLDGVAIGVGFRAGTEIGLLIALAVLAHDFADGLNTVSMMLAHDNPVRRALRWLMVDAIAPLLGATTVFLAPLPGAAVGWILAFVIGFFLYISASDLLPHARQDASPWVAVASAGGLALLFGLTRALASLG